MLHTQQDAQHIGIERGRIALCGLIRYETSPPLSRGVVDGNIEATKARDGFIDQVTHIVFVAHVGTQILRFNADLAEFGD